MIDWLNNILYNDKSKIHGIHVHLLYYMSLYFFQEIKAITFGVWPKEIKGFLSAYLIKYSAIANNVIQLILLICCTDYKWTTISSSGTFCNYNLVEIEIVAVVVVVVVVVKVVVVVVVVVYVVVLVVVVVVVVVIIVVDEK